MNTMNSTRLPTILGLDSAFPERVLGQEELWQGVFASWYGGVPTAREVMTQTRVETRHVAWDPRVELGVNSRSTAERMKAFERCAVPLGEEACGHALGEIGRERVGSFVLASCTGYAGPTPDLHIAHRLGLPATLRRTFVGHMGCYAAFNALKVGLDAVTARPDELALVACIELSSIQYRPRPATLEQAIIHALFGDAAAAAALVLGMAEPGSGPQVLATHTVQVYGTAEHMTWTVLDDGFIMTLSPYVPLILARHVEAFVVELCARAALDPAVIQHWGIHPGGPKIVEMIADKLAIPTRGREATWRVLETRGNCSSTTVLLVLEEILKHDRPRPGEIGVLMAFGPGLTMEGALVRF